LFSEIEAVVEDLGGVRTCHDDVATVARHGDGEEG
jgi:hypothetical protein